MPKKTLLMILFSMGALMADSTPVMSSSQITNPTLKGIVLLGAYDDFIPDTSKMSGISFRDIAVPGGSQGLEDRLRIYLDTHAVTQDTLTVIKREIILYYREHDHPVILVLAPEQDVTNGVLQLVVMESRVGDIEFIGNRHFSTELLQKYVRLNPGDTIDSTQILSDVSWMNRNPFHHTDVVLTPGKTSGTTDIRYITEDRRSVRIYAGGDNTGNDHTGNARLMAGINWANAFGVDEILTYQYTTSTDFHKFQAHTLNYVVPLPWRNILTLYGGYSTVHPHFEPFRSHGQAGQGSLRYQIPVGKTYTSFIQNIDAGFDYKGTNNALDFFDIPIDSTSGTVNLTQLVLAYSLNYEFPMHKIGFQTELFWSPGIWIPHQSRKDYEKLRQGATPYYFYGQVRLDDYVSFAHWLLFMEGRAQVSTASLLPSEQFGLGGYNTVRGYQERLVNVDTGFCFNVEARSNGIKVLQRWKKSVKDSLTFLGFVDFGTGYNHNSIPELDGWQSLLGIGPGVRYQIGSWLTGRLDWAFPLLKVADHKRHQRLHFSLILSY
ncbi:MAG: ShlB/FhaC/HecB family hemolysin secretion/activation protein [Verrucomicrobia bacterium]|nr:ShlB/FhaC/HecB family hemolysin secretion/activation protein [Verrucomicrobiota bacterium]